MNNPGRPGSRNRWGEFKPAAEVRSPGWRSRVAPLLMAGFLLLALRLPAAPVQAASADLTLTEKDSGRLVTLKVGETLLLNLRNPGSGGYSVLPPVYDGGILTLRSRRDLPPTQSRPGDFGRIEMVWQARQAGDTEVTVNIARPWEKHKSPEQFLKIRVRVKN